MGPHPMTSFKPNSSHSHYFMIQSHVSFHGELGLQHVNRGGRTQAFSPQGDDVWWKMAGPTNTGALPPWGSYTATRIQGHDDIGEEKKQRENIGTERHVACSSVNRTFIFSTIYLYLVACFRVAHCLRAQLKSHHRASKPLPLFVAGFREMGRRLCFLTGSWPKAAWSSLRLAASPARWLSSLNNLRTTNGGSLSADSHFITFFHVPLVRRKSVGPTHTKGEQRAQAWK